MQTAMRRGPALLGVAALTMSGVLVGATDAHAAYTYTEIPQKSMTPVWADSIEETGEGANGPLSLVLDGEPATYWHTKWQPAKDPLPHSFVIALGAQPVENVGRIVLTPRQSSNGSGRVNDYVVETSVDPACALAESAGAGAWTRNAAGSVAATQGTADVTVDFDPVAARCVKVTYLSSWGGNSSAETVASLAEFRAYTRAGTQDPQPGAPAATDPLSPRELEGAPSLESDEMTVRFDPAFPQVLDYRMGDETVLGSLREAPQTILLDEKPARVEVGTPMRSGTTLTYPLTFPDNDVSMKAVFTIDGATLTFSLTEITGEVHRVRIPHHDIVTLDAAVARSQISAQMVSVNREASGDRFEPLAGVHAASTEQGSHRILANTDAVAIAFTGNSIEDNTGPRSTSSRVANDNNRWLRTYREVEGRYVGSISSGTWVHRGSTADEGIGPDPAPYWKVKLSGDRNSDDAVDWQDAAISFRDIRADNNGKDNVAYKVITRIPFNIVSQATHPFLRTLDDTKRVALETDGLGQQVMLKGYEAEGHDSAHPDYAGHYNERAGGLADLKTLVNAGDAWNASFGVHVNTTESYSEAHAFSEDLITMPPQKAWGWMNQAYYINQAHDLGSGNVLKRFADFRKEVPANLNWLYIDVFYPNGWVGHRLGHELQKQGWVLGSEWSDKFTDYSVWSHWSQEERYGGKQNKGWNSQIFRFMENSYRDQFNPDPILGNSNIIEYEGWGGLNDHGAFIRNVWERNLPTKFLQLSPIMKWEDGRIAFENGTVATSSVSAVDGTTIPTQRTITFDGADVYVPGGAYLLPWKDGGRATSTQDGRDRLYHYNPAGGETTWTLTDAWKSQTGLELYKLTDQGRVKVGDVAVADGKVTLSGIEAKQAYVLYPKGSVPEAVSPNWGEGGPIADPGFFSGTLDAYDATGTVEVVKTNRGNLQAVMRAGAPASLAQTFDLPAGTYSAWAQVAISPGATREVTVSASGQGVEATNYQQMRASDKRPQTVITASTATNRTGSDEKYGTNFQRVPVRFSTSGGPVTFAIEAAEGNAEVHIDDLRVVEWKDTPIPPANGDAITVYYQDFENVDTGYWPFVTGSANGKGDARTQLAERHEPYSRKGWYGVRDNKVVEGGKLLDNVLEGQWSLMAHEESNGQILRTTEASLPRFEPGYTYRISFDYQAAYADAYTVNLRDDRVSNGRVRALTLKTTPLPQARETARYEVEFVPASEGRPYIEIVKKGGGNQNDLVIDNFRVERIAKTDEPATEDVNGPIVDLENPVPGEYVSIARTFNDCVPSEELTGEKAPNGPADAAIDGNVNSFWHTRWSAGADAFPHCLILELAEDKDWTITGFEYTARQDAPNSRAKGYEIFVSSDGKEWTKVADGEFKNVTEPQAMNFADDQRLKGRFVKFVQTSSQTGNRFGGAAELRIGATADGVEPADTPDTSPATGDGGTTNEVFVPEVTYPKDPQPGEKPEPGDGEKPQPGEDSEKPNPGREDSETGDGDVTAPSGGEKPKPDEEGTQRAGGEKPKPGGETTPAPQGTAPAPGTRQEMTSPAVVKHEQQRLARTGAHGAALALVAGVLVVAGAALATRRTAR
ncbi:MAG: endo-alpha-N-acetylgalactosaminidase family protein [Actinomycetaceae bacterium]|nr:endo-alpha-N-acetylgalactosaminidase family protein [Actinomycetaceae bacterium]